MCSREKQEDLLKQKNEETLRRLTAQAAGAGDGGDGGKGRLISNVRRGRANGHRGCNTSWGALGRHIAVHSVCPVHATRRHHMQWKLLVAFALSMSSGQLVVLQPPCCQAGMLAISCTSSFTQSLLLCAAVLPTCAAVILSPSQVQAYRNLADLPHARDLQITVDSKNEAVLVPIYGVMVPLHITSVRNVQNTAEQESNGAIVRISLNFGCVGMWLVTHIGLGGGRGSTGPEPGIDMEGGWLVGCAWIGQRG